MKFKILTRSILPIAVLGSFVFYVAFAFDVSSEEPRWNIPTLLSGQENIPLAVPSAGLPVRLKIPAINVDSLVEYVGLTPDGAVDVPKDPDDVAWFEPGPRPGYIGSAVIAGHFGWKDNVPAVFDDLNKLQKGDKIYVEDDEGAIVTFVVRELKIYDEKADARDVFVSNDEKAHLNLVTCGGTWNKAEKSYSNRLVVFADKE